MARRESLFIVPVEADPWIINSRPAGIPAYETVVKPRLKFLIVCPAARAFRMTARRRRTSVRMRVFRFSMLTPLAVAAAAPDFVDCRIIDESVEPVDLDSDADVVGLSFMTFNAPRAYELARAFKQRGKTVILGGYHPSLMPEEAIRHGDAVCIGDAEASLPPMFEDLRRGSLQPFYRQPPDHFARRRVDRSLLRRRAYLTPAVVQATRGCRFGCEFCSIAAFSRGRFQTRPVNEVLEEIRCLPGRGFLFMDDNLVADREYARRLLTGLLPMRRRWFAQMGVHVARDREFLDLLGRSGCRGVFVGLESLSQASLDGASKSFNRAEAYAEAVRRFHDHGIAVMGAIVLGFDQDTSDTLELTARFLRSAGLDALQLTLLTPLPGTPLFARMSAEGRILDRDWEHYDLGHLVFRPARLAAGQLTAAHAAMLRRFYSWPAMLRRLRRQWRYLAPREIVLSFLVGLGYRFKLRRTGIWERARLQTERTSEPVAAASPSLRFFGGSGVQADPGWRG